MHLGLYEIAMILGGLLLVLAGGVILWAGRKESRGLTGSAGSPPPANRALGSLASRYLLAVVLLIWGYHLAMWAFPPRVNAVQFPRDRWWIVFAAGISAFALSRIADLQTARRT